MILGAHNAWSYLTPRTWWMRLISFTARCQRVDIKDQYNRFGVRCFDLRIRFNKKELPVICHGIVEYEYEYSTLLDDLKWLQSKGDVVIRLLLELRGVKRKDWKKQKILFNTFYLTILSIMYPNITFVRGSSLPDGEKIIKNLPELKESESYASVSNPKYIDDWIPILYSKWHNRIARNLENRKEDILLLDFVDIN